MSAPPRRSREKRTEARRPPSLSVKPQSKHLPRPTSANIHSTHCQPTPEMNPLISPSIQRTVSCTPWHWSRGDNRVAVVIVPDPIFAKGKGRTPSVERLLPHFELAYFVGSGFPPQRRVFRWPIVWREASGEDQGRYRRQHPVRSDALCI